jgi:RNA polymerase sigma factor (sigma-70 family)
VSPSGGAGRAGAAPEVVWDECSPPASAAAGERAGDGGERADGAGERTVGAGERGRGAGERAGDGGERADGAGERTVGAGERGRGAGERAGESRGRAVGPAARKRVAVETFAREETAYRRTALRYSICEDDAEEALQRALVILLTKAPSEDPKVLVRWTQTVVKHEALGVRAERERTLPGAVELEAHPTPEDWISLLPTDEDGPAEHAERHEAIERSREALTTLKPQELRALTLLAEGYTYAEIGDRTGWTSTKINRCLAEGRERFRRFLVRRDGGARCGELAPIISAFVDDEAEPGDVAELREHLRTCPHCRATVRAYRAVPGAAAALAPVLPLRGPLMGRLHDAYAAIATRVGGGSPASESTLGNLAAAGGTRGAGMTALAKVLAICAGTVGGAACVATGIVPAPLIASSDHHSQPAAKVAHHRPAHDRAEDAVVTSPDPTYETTEEPLGEEATAEPQPHEAAPPEHHKHKPKEEQVEEATPTVEEAPVEATPPPSESGATEAVEAPPVETVSAPSSSSSAAGTSSSAGATSPSTSVGSAAGEMGP